MSEAWRSVVGWSNYEVSDVGRVRSVPRMVRGRQLGHIMKAQLRRGYERVHLQKDGKHGHRFVHHLVLEAFVGLRRESQQCRHLNGCRSDNKLENLAWGSVGENARDRVNHGTQARGEKHGSAKLSVVDVVSIRADGRPSRVVADDYGVNPCTVQRIKNGTIWSHVDAPSGDDDLPSDASEDAPR